MHNFLKMCLLLSLLSGIGSSAYAQTGPQTYFVVHCDTQNASLASWGELINLVNEAEARNIPLSIEFGVGWANLIWADSAKILQVRQWQIAGHAIGAHHHGLTHPFWDQYTDVDPANVNRIEPVLGTMADFKALIDPIVGVDGIQFGGIQDADYEMPFGIPFQTEGGLPVGNAVSTPTRSVENKYGVWQIGYSYLDSAAKLSALQTLHDQTSSTNVFGVVTHVYEYTAIPTVITGWFDFLYAKDPQGLLNKKATDILQGFEPALVTDTASFNVGTGAVIAFDLQTGDLGLSGHSYQFLITMAGSSPGLDYGGIYDVGVHLGINPDWWTRVCQMPGLSAYFPKFFGTVDSQGAATAKIDTMGPINPNLIGQSISAIAIIFYNNAIEFSSNEVNIVIK